MTSEGRKAGRAAVGYGLLALFVALDTLGEFPEGRFMWRSAAGFLLAALALERAVDSFRRWRTDRTDYAPGDGHR
ncbi:hypothetical protein [Cryptosporangium aurantiacum]|uniref:hypothetical protein n=1 Tax=Cryptosporangium aurantiacum TaxID=134849 RepID=UPI0009333AC4|nr:hypothetical protein [Cryptosporangium aurantiacum]